MCIDLLPRAHARYLKLPLLGDHLDGLGQRRLRRGSRPCGFADGSARCLRSRLCWRPTAFATSSKCRRSVSSRWLPAQPAQMWTCQRSLGPWPRTSTTATCCTLWIRIPAHTSSVPIRVDRRLWSRGLTRKHTAASSTRRLAAGRAARYIDEMCTLLWESRATPKKPAPLLPMHYSRPAMADAVTTERHALHQSGASVLRQSKSDGLVTVLTPPPRRRFFWTGTSA